MKFQIDQYMLVCPEIEKISISVFFSRIAVFEPVNNLQPSEKCFGAGNMSKIDFCCSFLLDFYAKIIKIDVFLMIFPTS
jgi:hypothetical protein